MPHDLARDDTQTRQTHTHSLSSQIAKKHTHIDTHTDRHMHLDENRDRDENHDFLA